MLQRLALATPPDEFAQRRELRLGQLALEFQIQVDPFPRKHMR